jgi:polyribonucleotide nucleotidyltransferase
MEANGYPVGSLRSVGPKESEEMMDLKKWEAEQMLVGQGGAFDKEEYKRSFLHYDFPSYSVGEVAGKTGPNRRR